MDWLMPTKHIQRRRRAGGFTLMELGVALGILAIGMLGAATLIYTSIVVNGRSSSNSTASMLNQAIVEQVNSVLVGTGSGSLSDCTPNTWVINTVPGGATLNSAGVVDFTETDPPDGYAMQYALCSGPNKQIFDVRWNVQMITPAIYLVTVGTRAKDRPDLLPANVRVYVSNTLWEHSS